jgi:starch synthase
MASRPLRVLFVASEASPWVKTGGLADVGGALPAALLGLGVDARLLIPGYPGVMSAFGNAPVRRTLPAIAAVPKGTLRLGCAASGVPVYVLDTPQLFQRDGGPYADAWGNDWGDNPVRFAQLSWAAACVGRGLAGLDWTPDIVHCNDWQTGLAPAYLRLAGDTGRATVMTIHNLAFQGKFDPGLVTALGLPAWCHRVDGVEFYGTMSFLKAGIFYADRITTVSPTYAREIQSEPLGFGMQGLLSGRGRDLLGILNGIDSTEWDPARDPLIAAAYDANRLPRKAANKAALQRELGLEETRDLPLFGVVSRLTYQKGHDVTAAIADAIADMPAQLAVLGSGEGHIVGTLEGARYRHPGRVAFWGGYDEGLAHRIEAGSDAFLMPSRFEPCGLNQLYSQRYGTPPVVHATGGLADSVVDCPWDAQAKTTGATGFVFHGVEPHALLETLRRVVHAWRNPPLWRRLQRNGMRADFGWAASAARYRDLYASLAPPEARP